MKEAAGEANMTVLTIILIGVVLAAGILIVNTVMDKIKSKSDGIDAMDPNAYITDTYNYYI